MYCKHCGKEIDDNSTFCKYCGKSQVNKNRNTTFIPICIAYLTWFIINMYLFIGNKNEDDIEYFFPFTEHDHYHIHYPLFNHYYYDYTELIVYVYILPAMLYIIYKCYNKLKNKRINK